MPSRDLGSPENPVGSLGVTLPLTALDSLIPGDWVDIFGVIGYQTKHPTGGFPSEATIYAGKKDGKYYFYSGVLGKGEMSLQEIREALLEKYNEDTTVAEAMVGPGVPVPLRTAKIDKADMARKMPSFVRVRKPFIPK